MRKTTHKIRQPRHGEEWHIQKDVIVMLRARGWHVERMIGTAWQFGIPDLYLYHRKWGERWVDIKRSGKNYSFTKMQRLKWPIWEQAGIGIWILTAATQIEYDKLMSPPNMRDYWKACWKTPTQADIDKMLEEMG